MTVTCETCGQAVPAVLPDLRPADCPPTELDEQGIPYALAVVPMRSPIDQQPVPFGCLIYVLGHVDFDICVDGEPVEGCGAFDRRAGWVLCRVGGVKAVRYGTVTIVTPKKARAKGGAA
jgi:hypothetical protein